MEAFYRLELRAIWQQFRKEHFSFWMICAYLFVEYVRPQSIMPSLDFLPWAKVFLSLSFLGLLADRDKRWVGDPANLLMTLFLCAILLSSSFAVFPQISWLHWFDFFGWYLIYFLVIHLVTTEKRFFIFLAIFLLASFKLSFFGARTWTMRGFSFTNWGIAGPPGFFQNSGELSIQMLMMAPLAYQAALFLKPHISKVKYWLLLLMPITASMTVIGASSRGAQIGLVYQLYRALLKGKMSIRALIIVGLVASAAWAVLPQEQKARFSSAGEDTTSQQRLLYWKRGIEMVETHPVLGVGFYNFPAYFATHYPQDMLYGAAQLPHNIFVQVGTDTGLVGLAIFLGLLWRNFRCCNEVLRLTAAQHEEASFTASMAKGLKISMWGFIIAGQFVTVTYYPFPWINLAMSVALLNIVKRSLPPKPKPKVYA